MIVLSFIKVISKIFVQKNLRTYYLGFLEHDFQNENFGIGFHNGIFEIKNSMHEIYYETGFFRTIFSRIIFQNICNIFKNNFPRMNFSKNAKFILKEIFKIAFFPKTCSLFFFLYNNYGVAIIIETETDMFY